MTGEPIEGVPAMSAAAPVTGWRRVLREFENLLVVLSLAALMPLPLIEMVLPIGFGLVAARLLWHAAGHWKGRAAGLALASAIVLFFAHSPLAPERLVAPALVALLAATVLGAPVFTTIGGAALILFWGDQSPIATIPLKHYSLVTNPSLPTIPLFTLAGYFLAEGGASRRLVRVFQALFGLG